MLQTKSGKALHPIGIGTWGMGTYPMSSPGTDGEVRALQYAFSLGQDHIDTAEMYANGGAEKVVGKAIHGQPREDLFVTTKLWKDHIATGTVRPAVEAMLQRLGTSYIDMLYIHAPWFDQPWQQAIPEIDQLIDEGVVRYLGVSNFHANHVQTALGIARHPIAANQMHYNVGHQQEVTPELQELCRAHGITIVAYQPLGRGEVLGQPLIQELASQHQASPAQIALAWLLAQGALPIPKAGNNAHISENAAASNIVLTPAEIQRLNS